MSESLADVVHEEIRKVALPEFLLARIAEDEASAHRAAWVLGRAEVPATACQVAGEVVYRPSRVLAECEAKRRIVAEWQRFETENRRAYGVNPVPSIIARALAQPYAEHPDFDPSWRL